MPSFDETLTDDPVLLDERYGRKPAYEAVLDALPYLFDESLGGWDGLDDVRLMRRSRRLLSSGLPA